MKTNDWGDVAVARRATNDWGDVAVSNSEAGGESEAVAAPLLEQAEHVSDLAAAAKPTAVERNSQSIANALGWTEWMVGGLAHPLQTAESGIEGAAVLSGAAKPGSRLLIRPSEQITKPLFGEIPQVPQQKSLAGQVGGGVLNAAIDFANFMQTTEGALTLGVGGLPATSQKAILRTFAVDLAAHAPEQLISAVEAGKQGNWQEAAKQATAGVGGTLMAKTLANHEGKPAGRLQPEGMTEAEAAANEAAVRGMMPGVSEGTLDRLSAEAKDPSVREQRRDVARQARAAATAAPPEEKVMTIAAENAKAANAPATAAAVESVAKITEQTGEQNAIPKREAETVLQNVPAQSVASQGQVSAKESAEGVRGGVASPELAGGAQGAEQPPVVSEFPIGSAHELRSEQHTGQVTVVGHGEKMFRGNPSRTITVRTGKGKDVTLWESDFKRLSEPAAPSIEQHLATAEQPRVTTPEGATQIRVTDNKGRVSVQPISALKKANPFRGVEIAKVEPGTIDKSGKFKAMAGEVEVKEMPPVSDEPTKRPSPASLGVRPAAASIADAANHLREATRNWWKSLDIHKTMTAWWNAVGNKANLYGRQVSNDLHDQLRTVMQRANNMKIDDAALRFVIQAQGDAGNLLRFQAQVQPVAKWWAFPAKKAIAHAIANWDRLSLVAEEFKKQTDAQIAQENAAGMPTEYRSGYVPNPVDVDTDYALLFQDKPGGGAASGFLRQRVYPDTASQIAAGVKPKELGAIAALERRLSAGQRMINKREYFNALRGVTDPVTRKPIVESMIRTRKQLPPGVTPHSEFQEVAPSGYVPYDLGFDKVAVHEGYSKLLDALSSKSAFEHSPIGQSIQQGTYAAKHATVLFDVYHFFKLSKFGASTWSALKPTRGLWLIDHTPAELQRMSLRGDIPSAELPGILRDKKIVTQMVEEGYNLGRIRDQMYSDWFQHIPGIGRWNRWLFDQYQRGIMAHVGVNEFNRYKSMFPHLPDTEIARRAAYDLNIRFGNLMKQSWIKSETFRDMANLLFLAPQWNEGLLRAEIGAVRGAGEAVQQSILQRRLVGGALVRSAGTLFVASFIGNQILNYLSRGHSTMENPEQDRKLDAFVPDFLGKSKGFFVSPLTDAAEISHQIYQRTIRRDSTMKGIRDVMSYKLSPGGRAAWSFISQQDMQGHPVEGWQEALAQAIPSPIGGGTLLRALRGEAEQIPGERQKQLMSSMGEKTDIAPSPRQQLQQLHQEWMRKSTDPKVQADYKRASQTHFAPVYSDLDNALRTGNDEKALASIEELRLTHSDKAILARMKPGKPLFHETHKVENSFKASLSEEQRKLYDQAKKDRRDEYERFLKLWAKRKLR